MEGRPVVVEAVVDEATVVVGTSGPEVVVADSPLLAGMEAAAVVVPALEVAVAATVGVTEAELPAVAPATGGRLSSPIPARQDRRLLSFLAPMPSAATLFENKNLQQKHFPLHLSRLSTGSSVKRH